VTITPPEPTQGRIPPLFFVQRRDCAALRREIISEEERWSSEHESLIALALDLLRTQGRGAAVAALSACTDAAEAEAIVRFAVVRLREPAGPARRVGGWIDAFS